MCVCVCATDVRVIPGRGARNDTRCVAETGNGTTRAAAPCPTDFYKLCARDAQLADG